jgi:hypothetical protein
VHNEFERFWKGAIVACAKILSQEFPVTSEGRDEDSQSL